MDSDLWTLVSQAASAVVGALATDAWETVRGALGRLWRRTRPEQAGQVEADLAAARDELSTAEPASRAEVAASLTREWEVRLVRLVTDDPSVTVMLRQLLREELRPTLDQPPAGDQVVMRAHARDGGRVYQAGRDQHISAS